MTPQHSFEIWWEMQRPGEGEFRVEKREVGRESLPLCSFSDLTHTHTHHHFLHSGAVQLCVLHLGSSMGFFYGPSGLPRVPCWAWSPSPLQLKFNPVLLSSVGSAISVEKWFPAWPKGCVNLPAWERGQTLPPEAGARLD